MTAGDVVADLVFGGVCALAGALGAVYLPRWWARIDLSRLRIIPPPRGEGRWQVWAVSRYPSGREYPVGRYRTRWVARRIARYLNDGPDSTVRRFEARRSTIAAVRRESDELEAAVEDAIAEHIARYHPARGCIENEAGECLDRFGGSARRRR